MVRLKTVNLFLDLPVPEVNISGAIVSAAGERFELTCTMTVVDHLIANAIRTLTWSGGSVNRGASVKESETTTSGVTSSRTLTFSPLSTSHGAEYTCQAEISIPSINVTSSGSESRAVMVQSQLLHLCPALLHSASLYLSLSPQASGDGVSSRVRVSVWLSSLPHLLHPAQLCGHTHHCHVQLDCS